MYLKDQNWNKIDKIYLVNISCEAQAKLPQPTPQPETHRKQCVRSGVACTAIFNGAPTLRIIIMPGGRASHLPLRLLMETIVGAGSHYVWGPFMPPGHRQMTERQHLFVGARPLARVYLRDVQIARHFLSVNPKCSPRTGTTVIIIMPKLKLWLGFQQQINDCKLLGKYSKLKTFFQYFFCSPYLKSQIKKSVQS